MTWGGSCKIMGLRCKCKVNVITARQIVVFAMVLAPNEINTADIRQLFIHWNC